MFRLALVLFCFVGLVANERVAALGAEGLTAGQGILVGEVTPASAIIKARLTAGDSLVDGQVPGVEGEGKFVLKTVHAEDEASPRESALLKAISEHDFMLTAYFDDLQPATLYQVELQARAKGEEELQTLASATFRTLAGAEIAREVNFVVVTGMNYAKFHGDNRIDLKEHKIKNNTDLPDSYQGKDKELGYPALETIKKLRPDFFVGTGDNVYYDTPTDPRAKTADEMRRKWQQQFVQPRYRQLFSVVPTYWEVDDHDYRKDDCDNTGAYAPSPVLARKILFEQLPMVPPDGTNAKTYRTYRVSKDLQVWFVENRFYRSPNKMPDGPGKTIWGKEQKEWLKETLAESDATFKILISPTPMIGPDDMRKTDNHTNLGGFRHEGREFFQWLQDEGLLKRHFYIICGDRHWQYHSIDPTGVEEFSCGALVDANSRLGRKPGDPKSTDPDGEIVQPYYQTPASGGFLHVRVKPGGGGEQPRLYFCFMDEHGVLLHEHEKTAS
ncbi:alkaline phosphatase D family protein [Calycomorphotria hydatis]|uniref:PhoD-like phosphatase n=1 Tax=Calycomorphotria hydatis TaxID=2528027 RepID=A0A517TDC1_9PLAN|nr:alkaline phosphatase D family protein [Calycomorphotria hydatis]QDT66362.1 PhoD-like phosphatase [Calycomorphotria hydatis]